jgi:hypothetical protein
MLFDCMHTMLVANRQVQLFFLVLGRLASVVVWF